MQNKISALCFILAIFTSVKGQQDPQFSMYMFNRQIINPAFVGLEGWTNLTSAVRTQWVGIEGAPKTITASINSPVEILHGAIGAVLYNDRIGQFNTNVLKANYAYRIDLGEPDDQHSLQIGIGLGLLNKNIDFKFRTVFNNSWSDGSEDPLLTTLQGNGSGTLFDLGAGLYYQFKRNKGYIGIGSEHLTEPSLKSLGDGLNAKIPRHYNLLAGYRINLNALNMTMVPSIMLKNAGPQTQLDINLNLVFDPIVLGVSYRIGDALIGLMGLQATDNLFVAYSYDYTLSKLGPYTSGSHELVITYLIPTKVKFRPPDWGVRHNPTIRIPTDK